MHDILSPQHQSELNALLKHTHRLINGMITILSEAKRPPPLFPTLQAVKLSQMVTQACWSDQELLQVSATASSLNFIKNNTFTHTNASFFLHTVAAY